MSFLNLRKYFLITAFLYVCLIPFIALSSASRSLSGTVQQVKDGDTIVIAPSEGGEFFICRLYGIDTPETSQPYGEEATKELKLLVLAQTVEVTTTGDKTYNREVCFIQKESLDINLEMVKRGYAWAYVQYLKRPHASEYIDAERIARENKLGLWKDRNPVPPWEFRKKRKHGATGFL